MDKLEDRIKVILWDFDGVLMDSMPIRDQGFEIVLADFPKSELQRLMDFHRKNGGLSRYVKFRYFFEEIIGESVSEEQINDYAGRFSEVMLAKLVDPDLLIQDAVEFVKRNHPKYEMHVVSGSDQEELRHLCAELGLKKYFKSVNGSPTPKKQLVKQLLEKHSYKREEVVLIGDSINDYEAAEENNIKFLGYNNQKLRSLKAGYITSLKDMKILSANFQ